MAKNGFKFMDSDMHVIEPADLWQRYIDPAFKDRAPRGLNRYQQDLSIEVEGYRIPEEWTDPLIESLAGPKEVYGDPLQNNWDAASQVRAMDREGIDFAIIYPSRGLFVLAIDNMDPALAAAIARAYNDWVHDFCSYDTDRMVGVAMLSPFDKESSVAEARRAVEELGHKAVFLRPNIVNGRNWHDPYYDPLWAEIERLGVPLGFHEGSHVPLAETGDRFDDKYWMFHTCCHSMEMMLAVVSMIGGGVLERFPGLKVAFLEANCSWVPWLLWRLDDHYEHTGMIESPDLKMEPSEYFKRQCFVSAEADETPTKVMEQFGLTDNVVFSTDYPHQDAKYPHASEAFLELALSHDAKRKILWDNCARLYESATN